MTIYIPMWLVYLIGVPLGIGLLAGVLFLCFVGLMTLRVLGSGRGMF